MDRVRKLGLKRSSIVISCVTFCWVSWACADARLEEIIVVSEKRSESLQDLSQAVTALSGEDLDAKNINSFVDLSAIAPGVTVAKNEGFKTIISIRGVGNETNQNAIAAPSVSYHMDGIYIASPFSLQTDFIDVERVEVLRGPQGTLFGQNSTGGAINVISKPPSVEEMSGKTDLTIGDHGLVKARGSINVPISDTAATRTSISITERDGFSDNTYTGQELDDASHISFRTDWSFFLNEDTNLRFFAQYFEADNNGAAIKGIDDPTPDPRKLSQETISDYQLESKVVAGILESDLGSVTVKALMSWQEDDIRVVRDNDRHNWFQEGNTYLRSEFNPESAIVNTKTAEINLISNEPLFGSLDWIVGAFYYDFEYENHIREFIDFGWDGNFDGSFDDPTLGITIPGEWGFISDAVPTRESHSFYGQTTYSFSDNFRLITGLRYTEDTVESRVSNFFSPVVRIYQALDEMTGRIAGEYDFGGDSMAYISYTLGFKPGGSNLTYGFTKAEDAEMGNAIAPPLVFPTFESETITAYEIGLKTDILDGRVRANIAAFLYDYEDLQFQATDPDVFRGGVANIPESEMKGLEIEFLALLSDSWSLDVKMAFLDSEITADYDTLDNVKAGPYFFGQEDIRYSLRENINGNELAKSPDFTANASLTYQSDLASGHTVSGSIEIVHRGEFQQRVINNMSIDKVNDYTLVNLVTSIQPVNSAWSFSLMVFNATDEDGVNSSMTDVFGVNATGLELIPPRQVKGRVSYDF